MWYKKTENEKGIYQDSEGKRFFIVQCFRAVAPNGKSNGELGLTEFETLEDCLNEWKLTKVERKLIEDNGTETK